ncbi:MAG: exodeoxyribonuclease III [Candidatus Aminicenantes bacterium RBG_16_63_16]|nr:MAG: exodeoxyribonuclease III [Candidatus Aminicenantes bacterium RBG_16_63_16]
MKVCSYNVNSIKARLDLVLQWLDHRGNDIDVLCFQELKTEDSGFPVPEFEARGFDCRVFGQKGYNGVAILSKVPPRSTVKGFGQAAWDEQKRLIRAEVKGIQVMNIYAPHGDVRGTEKFDYKLRWYKNLVGYLDDNFSPDDPLLLVGDFNVAHRDIDVYSPEELEDMIGTMREEREAFAGLLDWGLVDAFRSLYPEKKQYTWWDYIGGAVWKDKGMRIDYALGTKPILKKIADIEVDLWPRKRQKPTPSDHAPVVISLRGR